MLQAGNFTRLLQHKLQETCQFHPVAKTLLKSSLLQPVTCKLSFNKLSQTVQTHPDIGLLIKLLQDHCKMSTD